MAEEMKIDGSTLHCKALRNYYCAFCGKKIILGYFPNLQ
ncbi:hypothetical protein D1BOALGB6SA_2944 [Olavius sp. associated proteobacterium Delta 1]|nr:hypothetical protein D1BOALGB6SA_2944 [Olavius sp. associated proteobacterium Delta 1]